MIPRDVRAKVQADRDRIAGKREEARKILAAGRVKGRDLPQDFLDELTEQTVVACGVVSALDEVLRAFDAHDDAEPAVSLDALRDETLDALTRAGNPMRAARIRGAVDVAAQRREVLTAYRSADIGHDPGLAAEAVDLLMLYALALNGHEVRRPSKGGA